MAEIKNVAVVGAAGHLGQHFVEELLKTGKHTVTAIMRKESKSTPPAGVKVAQVDYNDEESLISAFKGQQFLAITLPVYAAPDTHDKLVKAAGKAGIPYIMPNSYGYDIRNKSLTAEDLYGAQSLQRIAEVEKAGPAYIAMCCGFWYEWSLALGDPCFGFDIKNKKVTFFDEGKAPINVSTWIQCGRALAALVSLPESGGDKSVSAWKNQPLYISSFRVTQRDMLDSLHRVMGTKDSDWTITSEQSDQRYKGAIEEMQKGVRTGFIKAMYTRTFYPNGDGDYESAKGLANGVLGLPQESLDASTKKAVEMVESGWNPFG